MAARDLAAIIRAKDETQAELARARESLASLEKQFAATNQTAASSTGGIESFLGGVGKIAAGVGAAELALRAFDAAKEGAFKAAFGTNASLETATLQFEILMGSADRAKEHVQGLFDFAKATPFEAGPIIQASRTLEVFGGAALNTKETLRLVGDAAAGASAPIEEVGMWIARAYSAIQSGRPFGEAAQRLQELGLLSGDARARVEALAEAGVDSERVWAALTGELGRFSGSMEKLQGTWAGLTSTASDSVNLLLSGALKPLFEEAKKGLEEFNKVLESDEAKKWGESLRDTLNNDVIPALREAGDLAHDVATGIKNIPPRTQPEEQGGGPDIGGMLFRATPPGWPVLLKEQLGDLIRDLRELNALMLPPTHGMSPDEIWKQHIENLKKINLDPIPLDIELDTGMLDETFRREMEAFKQRVRDGVGGAAGDGASDGIDDAIATVRTINFGDRLAQAFRIGDAADELGDGGAELLAALAEGIDKNSDKTANLVEQQARKIMERWLKELNPEDARRRGAELQAALLAGASEDVSAQLRSGQQALDAKKAAEDARKEAERAKRDQEALKRDQEAALREAKRIADEWRRTMPITGANFAAAFEGASVGVGFGPGRAIFEGLQKAITDGGEQSIQAVGKLAAEMAQKMRDEFGPEDGEAWAAELISRVNQAIADGTDASRQAVGQWVKSFDIEAQLRQQGERAAATVNEAILRTQQAIHDAEENADTRIARIQASAVLQQARETERGGLQQDFDKALSDFQNAQRLLQMDRGFGREDRDTGTRQAREDLLAQQSAEKQAASREVAERKAQEAINDARFRGDTLGTLRAMKALEDQRKNQADQLKEAQRVRDQQRQWQEEDRDQRRQDARDDFAQAIKDAEGLQAKREELMGPLKEFAARVRGEDLEQSINDVLQARDETIGRLNQQLSDLTEKTQTDLDTLREKLTGTKDVADTMFSMALSEAQQIAAIFDRGILPGGLGGAINEAAAAEARDLAGPKVTIGTLNVTNNGYMGEGGPEALAAEMVAAEESLIQ